MAAARQSLARTERWRPVVLAALAMGALASATADARGQGRTWTFDGDFDQGTLAGVNHDAPNNNQLQLGSVDFVFPFINVAASVRGTVIRINTETGAIVGEYLTSPTGRPRNPSRTTVDRFGNVWVGNRDETATGGSITKIGVILGGTRGDKNPDGSFTPNPIGQYLQGPFQYTTCVDRDGDGLIRTSRGLANILAWPAGTDGDGSAGADGSALVRDAEDECIVVYQRLPSAPLVRHVSIDGDNNVWVGGWTGGANRFYKINGADGSFFPASPQTQFDVVGACGGYGGFVDGNGILWSAGLSSNGLLRYDPAAGTRTCIPVSISYGLGLDPSGNVWNTQWTNNTVTKLLPNGTVAPGFPKPTGGTNSRGVVATPNGDIWIANSGSHTVTHLNNAGTLLHTMPVGAQPTGVSVDAAGKVWVVALDGNTAQRIDPAANGGLGAVDLTVPLGAGAGPYNYSDMTGAVLGNVPTPFGTWAAVHDSGVPATPWHTVAWTELLPCASTIDVEVRAADTPGALAAALWVAVAVNGAGGIEGLGVVGRYIEVRVTLRRNGCPESPVLYDLTVLGGDDCGLWDNGDFDENGGHLSQLGQDPVTCEEFDYRVADDFYLEQGCVCRIETFRGTLLTDALIPDARLEVYADCGGLPGDLIGSFDDPVVRDTGADFQGLNVVEFTFEIDKLWLRGGQTYWVSLVGLTNQCRDEEYFWATAGDGVVKGRPGQFRSEFGGFPDWTNVDLLCCACTDFAFAIDGECCKVLLDNGPGSTEIVAPSVDNSPATGVNAFAADDVVVPPCRGVDLCFVEACVLTNCEPPRARLVIYGNDCDQPTGPIAAFDADCVVDTGEVVMVDGRPLRLVRAQFFSFGRSSDGRGSGSDPPWHLPGGRNYWFSVFAVGNGSLAQRGYLCGAERCELSCDGRTAHFHPGVVSGRAYDADNPERWISTGDLRSGPTDFAILVAIEKDDRPVLGTGDVLAPIEACPADSNRDGDVTVDDVFAFLSAWFRGCP